MLTIQRKKGSEVFEPLDRITLTGVSKGAISVWDGQGREYIRTKARPRVTFTVAGALGNHMVLLEDEQGRVTEKASFQVDCETGIEDAGGRFKRLLLMLHYTMIGRSSYGGAMWNDRVYRYFVSWIRDHVHTMKGMKYFSPEVKTAIELFRDSQRDDGMVFDLTNAHPAGGFVWDICFPYGDFIHVVDGGRRHFLRIPVENDVEYLYVEGIYHTWKACGDDAWMESMLESGMKALDYSVTDPYRWSKKYKLLRRGFTIDTWDFQSEEDAARSGHIMVVDLEKTRFGVMFGDNTGYAQSCRYMAEMLDHAGRPKEAARHRRRAEQIKRRLDKLAWNGRFYTHHVPEDRRLKRDVGVDQSKQVSLSNTYSLNRGLTQEQCAAIIKTYQRIKRNLPEGSPGEWYLIYPPFAPGTFVWHGKSWEYMDGGVSIIAAGELAHGAFEHGFEDYGVDILERLTALAEKSGGRFARVYKGARPAPPKRKFRPLDLTAVANCDLKGNGAPGHYRGLWDLDYVVDVALDLTGLPTGKQKMADAEFDVIDPKQNKGEACIGLADHDGYAMKAAVPVGKTARSLYLLHTTSGVPKSILTGMVTLEYADGTSHTEYVICDHQVAWWFLPDQPTGHVSWLLDCKARIGWQGSNKSCLRFGVTAYGIDNPHPRKKIERIVFEKAKQQGYWYVLAASLCDKEVYFKPGLTSYGIPENWGAAAVTYALIEGLAGIKDAGVAFDKVTLAPRWPAAGVKRVTATAKYEASGGYVRYRYSYDEKNGKVAMVLTGNSQVYEAELLLPGGRKLKGVVVDGKQAPFAKKRIERSVYVCFQVSGVGAHRIAVWLK